MNITIMKHIKISNCMFCINLTSFIAQWWFTLITQSIHFKIYLKMLIFPESLKHFCWIKKSRKSRTDHVIWGPMKGEIYGDIYIHKHIHTRTSRLLDWLGLGADSVKRDETQYLELAQTLLYMNNVVYDYNAAIC